MLRLRYRVPDQYSVAAEQFANDPWVHAVVKLAAEFEGATAYSIMMDNYRRHYDFPFDLFTDTAGIDDEMIASATPENVHIYDTDSP